MLDFQIGILGLVLLVLLIVLGMRVAYAVTLVGVIGLILLRGWSPAINLIGSIPSSIVGTYAYSTITLFVLMGYFAYYSKVADDLFESIRTWVQHIHGGLPSATILASAGFATVSGSSSASSAVLGKMTISKMLDVGVDKRLASGTVAMGGCIAVLIPPSTLVIIYGIMTEQSIASMLIAGIIPGIITVLLYILFIYVRVRMNPELAPIVPAFSWKERFSSLRKTVGIVMLVIIIVGGLFFGIFTPIEASGIGAAGALVIGIVLRRLNFKKIQMAMIETIKTSTMIFAIMVGISIFIRFLAFSGLTKAISDLILNLPFSAMGILIVILLILLVLGMFMDAISMMMLTLPLVFPIIVALDFNAVWFGIIVIKMAEIGLVSPPVGLNCFIVKGVAPKIPLGDIFRGVLPFIFVEAAIVVLLIAFPELVTFLPDLMRN